MKHGELSATRMVILPLPAELCKLVVLDTVNIAHIQLSGILSISWISKLKLFVGRHSGEYSKKKNGKAFCVGPSTVFQGLESIFGAKL